MCADMRTSGRSATTLLLDMSIIPDFRSTGPSSPHKIRALEVPSAHNEQMPPKGCIGVSEVVTTEADYRQMAIRVCAYTRVRVSVLCQ